MPLGCDHILLKARGLCSMVGLLCGSHPSVYLMSQVRAGISSHGPGNVTFMQVCWKHPSHLQVEISRLCHSSFSVHGSRCNFQARRYSARRAMLYVPGDDMRKLNKARSLDVDCVVMDCEDGVAANRKKLARENIRSLLDEDSISLLHSEWSVRVNSVDSGLCEDDVSVVLGGGRPAQTLLLPKVQSVDHVQWFSDKISTILRNKSATVNLVMFIESARAILRLPDICSKAQELSKASPFRPVALVFGSDDLCASLGVVRSTEGSEILYARQKLVLVAKAFNLQAIDMVHIQYQDLEGLKQQCEAGARMGYTGKQVIHPAQIPVVQQAFVPSPDCVEWARGVVEAFQQHDAQGKGAFVHKGSMIDMPTVLQARRVLQVASSVSNK